MDDPVIIHEYPIDEMPKRRLLKLFRRGAKLYKICENPDCDQHQQYVPITSDKELMTYCLSCARKIILYGLDGG